MGLSLIVMLDVRGFESESGELILFKRFDKISAAMSSLEECLDPM